MAPRSGSEQPPVRPDPGERPLRILTFSSLFPNPQQPNHGLFVAQRLTHLIADQPVQARVTAPVPWFPFRCSCFGRYGRLASVPARSEWGGLRVDHPRYPLIPKIGMSSAPLLMAAAVWPAVARILRNGARKADRRGGFDAPGFDLIDAHYFYPDGVAAALIGAWLDIPVVITARGADINLIPRFALPRRQILWAARRAAGLATVCAALKEALVALGVAPERVTVLRNGVDLERFAPLPREETRRALGMQGPTLLSVGHLIDRKGHDLAIRALTELPEATLWIVGEGERRAALEALAGSLGLTERVRFTGALPQAELPRYYSGADLLTLASSREGWANVLLEAMACGTPVVASPVWGTPELVCAPEAGALMTERSSAALTAAVRRVLAAPPERAATRRYAEGFSWRDTSRGQYRLFRQILERRRLETRERKRAGRG